MRLGDPLLPATSLPGQGGWPPTSTPIPAPPTPTASQCSLLLNAPFCSLGLPPADTPPMPLGHQYWELPNPILGCMWGWERPPALCSSLLPNPNCLPRFPPSAVWDGGNLSNSPANRAHTPPAVSQTPPHLPHFPDTPKTSALPRIFSNLS